jgi:hypothetical protein
LPLSCTSSGVETHALKVPRSFAPYDRCIPTRIDRLLKHTTTGKEVWVAVHTKKDAGRLGNRILRDAGVE